MKNVVMGNAAMKNAERKRAVDGMAGRMADRETGRIGVWKEAARGAAVFWRGVRLTKGKAAAALGMAAVFFSVGFCVPSINLATSVDNLMNLVFGVLLLIGLFMIITGVYAVIGALRDTEGGHDQGAVSKGIGKALTGLVMAAGPSVISLIIGLDPLHVGSSIFGG